MSLQTELTSEIATAMKAKDAARLSALRMLKAALMNREVEKARALQPGEEQQVVASLIKQRRDSIDQFRAGGRADLADKEQGEIAVLEAFMPPAVSESELASAVDRAVSDTGASSAKDIGRVMKAVLAAFPGQTVDGRRVNELVRARLAQ